MAVSLAFYNDTGDPRVAKKTFSGSTITATAYPLESVGTLTASYRLDYLASVMGCNYFTADGKIYKITERTMDPAGGMSVTGKEDALATFYNEVIACNAIIARNTQHYSMDIQDSRYIYKQRRSISTVDLGGISEDDFIAFGFVE